ncbi:hypothetical protein L1987_56506 [Smallanthus sonchifolius]|uniref:Uncharacterized protein n=1 Tax=Smallanthus sonchifolius TaxID=185202 RepID=A0ACB9ECI9_9ASTR|nr:hypothetical protein L1987_56506 [Smallanthus sonchifolius]
MPPRRDTTQVNEIATIITNQLANVLPGMVTQVSEALRNAGTTGGNINNASYKTFLACKPVEFFGSEGATGLLHWFEKMESILNMCDCPENLKVKYASSAFQKRALTWWNAQVRTRGREPAMAMPWNDFRGLMISEFCPKNELQKIEVEFWNHVMDGVA